MLSIEEVRVLECSKVFYIAINFGSYKHVKLMITIQTGSSKTAT